MSQCDFLKSKNEDQLTVTADKEKQQILTTEKLELRNVIFCL